MTVVRGAHEDHGATFVERGGRTVVAEYGRPERTAQAVRSGVGVRETACDVLAVSGDDRIDYVDNALSNRVPDSEGEGCYAVLLDPDGRIRTDCYVFHAGERLLCLLPPGRGEPIAEDWREKTFIEDVAFDVRTDDVAVFGLHGPHATEKVASVLAGGAPADEPLRLVRGAIDDAGVTVCRTDAPAGEESYEVVCDAEHADSVFDSLVNRGLNAAPFGLDVWHALTVEAGTPLFHSELEGRIPNVVGIRNALDFEKGCYVGQEVVSRIENRGTPNERVLGLVADAVPDDGAAVTAGDEAVGEVTRGVHSPARDEPIALALLDAAVEPGDELAVQVAGEPVDATATELPFVEGSERSARVPAYE